MARPRGNFISFVPVFIMFPRPRARARGSVRYYVTPAGRPEADDRVIYERGGTKATRSSFIFYGEGGGGASRRSRGWALPFGFPL